MDRVAEVVVDEIVDGALRVLDDDELEQIAAECKRRVGSNIDVGTCKCQRCGCRTCLITPSRLGNLTRRRCCRDPIAV